MKKLIILLFVIFCGAPLLFSQVNTVSVEKDEGGFRLMVDEKPFAIKGVVWSYTPIGQKYTYDLWSKPDEFIKQMIDTDAELMKSIGVNAIRVFSMVPPEWIEYFYYEHGIYTIVNYLFGRYGMSVRGKWFPQTDYSDRYTREAIAEEALEVVEEYKNTPGVLMFLFGNENNYGLEWDSNAIENLPVGQRMEVRAGYLYSLFEEVIAAAKTIDPNHPMGIVNGDIQYLHVIKDLMPSLEILGVNTYRGSEAYELFYQSIFDLGVPFVFTEMGADSWNVKTGMEDQYHQAFYLRNQWQEVYRQSWNKGYNQNCLGGFVFEWMDEWWKHGLDSNLDVHDTEGTWTNGAYSFDAVPGVNNMNEEWFGIVAQSTFKDGDVNRRVPRAAFYTLGDIWKLPLYESTREEVIAHFGEVDPLRYVALGETDVLKDKNKTSPVRIDNASLDFIFSERFKDTDLADAQADGRSELDGLTMHHSEELTLTVGLYPFEELSGDITVKFRGVAPNPLFTTPYDNRDYVELYSASFEYLNDYFALNGYYHVGLGDWYDEGDFFNLKPESWDLHTMDISGSKAPFGFMFTGADVLEGLKIFIGPEIYQDARPQVMAKYYRVFGKDSFDVGFSVLAAQEFNVLEIEKQYADPSQAVSLYGFFDMDPIIGIDVGMYFAGADKIGETYAYTEPAPPGQGFQSSDWYLHQDQEISFVDTLAAKIEIETDIVRYTKFYASYLYAGLVADTNAMIARGGFFKADSGSGNRHEVVAGTQLVLYDFTIDARFRYRVPLIDPFFDIGGISRHSLTDPFYVFHNRETIETEFVITYDPTGATWFHDWNSFDIEDARFAASASVIYTIFAGSTDKGIYRRYEDPTTKETLILDQFATGLPEAWHLWAAQIRLIANPLPLFRIGLEYHIGHEQSLGQDTRLVTYMGGALQLLYDRVSLDSMVEWNGWGPEPWYREFNVTYPWQWKVDVSYGFDMPKFLESSAKIGLFWEGRTFDQHSGAGEPKDGYQMEVGLYVSIYF